MSTNDFMKKITILSISILCMCAPSVSATIPAMVQTLRTQSQASIELLMSIPNFGILLFVFLSPVIHRYLKDKKTVCIGVFVTLVSGLVPVFTKNYTILLLSRFLLGCGVGMFNSLAYSLITIYYDGEERTRLLGLQGAVSAVASTVMSLCVGFLLQFGWQASYFVYLIALIPLILFLLFFKDQKISVAVTKQKQSITIHKTVYIYSMYMFVMFTCFMVVAFKLASVFVEKGYATAAQASMLSAVSSAIGFISGLLFVKVYGVLKHNTLPISMMVLGFCLLGIYFSDSFILSSICVIVSGLFSGFINPCVFGEVARVSNTASQTAASTCLLVGINLGCFLNPSIFGVISNIFQNDTVAFSFLVAGGLILCIGLGHLCISLLRKTEKVYS